jgi:hypothetical protein
MASNICQDRFLQGEIDEVSNHSTEAATSWRSIRAMESRWQHALATH